MTTRELFLEVTRAESLVRALTAAEEAAVVEFGEASYEAWVAAGKLYAADTALIVARRAHARVWK